VREELGCSIEEYTTLVGKVGDKTIYNFVIKYGSGIIGLYYFIDDRGRFVPPKYKQDYIAKAIMDSLTAGDKMNVLRYLEDLDDGDF